MLCNTLPVLLACFLSPETSLRKKGELSPVDICAMHDVQSIACRNMKCSTVSLNFPHAHWPDDAALIRWRYMLRLAMPALS